MVVTFLRLLPVNHHQVLLAINRLVLRQQHHLVVDMYRRQGTLHLAMPTHHLLMVIYHHLLAVLHRIEDTCRPLVGSIPRHLL